MKITTKHSAKQGDQRVICRASEYNVPQFLTDRPGWLSLFFDPPNNQTIGEDIDNLLLVKFHQIPLSSSGGISRKWLSQSEIREPCLFSDRPARMLISPFLLGFVKFGSVVAERSQKYLGQSEARSLHAKIQ